MLINSDHQHQCSSKAIVFNVSARYQLRKTYLIIDVEPVVDQQQQSYFSRAKEYLSYGPNDDSSISGILIGIGVVVVALFLLVIVIKLLHMCYKMWQDDDENKTDQAKKSPLLPSSGANVVRRNSSVRNPTASIHRSSLNIETQMELRQKRLSQTYSNTPPMIKKP